jgi:hypothetical protein
MTQKELEKLKDLVWDLAFDCQRMSQSGVEQYNEICKILKLEPYKEVF